MKNAIMLLSLFVLLTAPLSMYGIDDKEQPSPAILGIYGNVGIHQSLGNQQPFGSSIHLGMSLRRSNTEEVLSYDIGLVVTSNPVYGERQWHTFVFGVLVEAIDLEISDRLYTFEVPATVLCDILKVGSNALRLRMGGSMGVRLHHVAEVKIYLNGIETEHNYSDTQWLLQRSAGFMLSIVGGLEYTYSNFQVQAYYLHRTNTTLPRIIHIGLGYRIL